MIIRIDAKSDCGPIRHRNEDMILVREQTIRDTALSTQYAIDTPARHLIALADGMGGHNAGDVASRETLNSLAEFFKALPDGLSDADLSLSLGQWCLQTHIHLGRMGYENTDYYGMGTTLVGHLFYEGRPFWFNCGDSRVYRFSDGTLTQLSSDHSLEWLTGKPANGNVIVNCIGTADGRVFIDFEPIQTLKRGDSIVLCSDGLTDHLSDSHIARFLNAGAGADELIRAATLMGGNDNISVCIMTIVEE